MEEAIALLTAEVERTKTLQASAIVLITGLAEKLEEVADDPEAVLALVEELDNSADALAAALSANTPAAPVAEEPVVEEPVVEEPTV